MKTTRMAENIRMTRREAGGGFTLIEVLTAIVVLAITIPVLMRAYTIAGDVAAYTRQRAEATSVAQSAMDELVATGSWNGGTLNGEEKPGPTLYTWQGTLDSWGDSSVEDTTIQQLTVTVTWERQGKRTELSLVTLVYAPENSTLSTTTTTSGLP